MLSPATDTLVSGSPLVVRIWLQGSPSGLTERTDEGVVTRSFHRRGRELVGILPAVPGGRNSIEVTATIAGKVRRTGVAVTVKGRRTDLVSPTAPSGLTASVGTAGVRPMAICTDPSAAVIAILNGKRVSLPRPGPKSVRRFVLSVADGLTTRSNRFTVTGYLEDGAWDRETLTFDVPAVALLAELRAPTQVRAGEVITLDATSTLSSATTASPHKRSPARAPTRGRSRCSPGQVNSASSGRWFAGTGSTTS